MDIRHEPQNNRFVAEVDGNEAVLEYVDRGGGVLDYRHTFTPPALRGQGIAKHVVVFALEHARSHELKIIPTCPYVAKIIAEQDQYQSLVAARG
jgi:predicted GNAT family acetyltransferase